MNIEEPGVGPDEQVPPAQEAPAQEPGAQEPPARRPRRAAPTALLLAVAAVIGISGGTAVGYRIQADRAPDPLPALNQPGLAYPAKALPAGQEPEPLSAAEDSRVKTDGDLRKLLVPKPKGARESDRMQLNDGWLDTAEYADQFKSPRAMFEVLAQTDFRRAAVGMWRQGGNTYTYIRLVQFRSGIGAVRWADGQREYMSDAEGAGNGGEALKGSGNGRYYLYPVDRKAAYKPLYRARAVFQRGDIMVDIDIVDSARISKSAIRSLAERQLERLS